MQSNFPYSNSNKRYYTYDYYLKETYGSKVFKVAFDGGFTCPNRDGTKGYGGCIFCSSAGSGEFAGSRQDDLLTQFKKQTHIMHRKWPIARYIAYFQAYTNTYAPLADLKPLFETAIFYPNMVGIAIATRPDCLPTDVLDYLSELNTKTDVYIELGLQTVHEDTARIINRQYNYAVFTHAVQELAKRSLRIIVHLINGLPGETRDKMIETARAMSQLPLHGIKIHQLNILRDTAMERYYQQGKVTPLSQEEYVSVVIEQLRYFPAHFVIQRVTGDAKAGDLIAPDWSLKKTVVTNEIDKAMRRQEVIQGDRYGT